MSFPIPSPPKGTVISSWLVSDERHHLPIPPSLTNVQQPISNGFFLFAKKTVPQLLDAVSSAPHPPTLLVTGATASLRGGNRFATFAAGKFAQRALAQSLAREFGPKGVHVALAIIDGGIDVPWAPPPKQDDGVEDKKLKPEAVSSPPFRCLVLALCPVLMSDSPRRLPTAIGICMSSIAQLGPMS